MSKVDKVKNQGHNITKRVEAYKTARYELF